MKRHLGNRTAAAWAVLLAACTVGNGLVWAQDFEPYDPPQAVVPPGEQAPGQWPETVSGANFTVQVAPGSVLDGSGSDSLKVGLNGWGPMKWTESRHNEGDIATLFGLNDPGPASDPPTGFVDNYAAETGPTTHGWRTSYLMAVPLATVRVNGRDNGDTFDNGDPVGTFYGSAYFNAGFAQGWSYAMTSGGSFTSPTRPVSWSAVMSTDWMAADFTSGASFP